MCSYSRKWHPHVLLQSLKGPQAREVNRLLGRTGESFWKPSRTNVGLETLTCLGWIMAYIEDDREGG